MPGRLLETRDQRKYNKPAALDFVCGLKLDSSRSIRHFFFLLEKRIKGFLLFDFLRWPRKREQKGGRERDSFFPARERKREKTTKSPNCHLKTTLRTFQVIYTHAHSLDIFRVTIPYMLQSYMLYYGKIIAILDCHD